MPEATRQFAEAAMAEARAMDGCEGLVAVTDPSTGESISITLFRDQAALDAAQAWVDQKLSETEALEGHPTAEAPRVFTEVLANL